MKIDIFSVEYLQFIFTNLWTFFGFVIILLILTNGMRKAIEPIRITVKNFFAEVKKRYDHKRYESAMTEKIKTKIPQGMTDEFR